MNNINNLKLAFLGVSHWHVPLYLEAVKTEGLCVAAVSDPDPACAERVGRELGCSAYTDALELMDKEKPDFVFAFDMHCRMPALAEAIIERKIPFSIEKPLGLKMEDARHIQELAEKNHVFCAIPFIWRYSALVKELRENIKPEDFVNFSFIFTAGPPSRYEKTSPWMLEKKLAGGGCMTNLGVHFIDMALLLSGSDSAKVLGSQFHYMNGYDVEDSAEAVCRLSSGASLVVQTGYAYPMDQENKRDNRWNFTTKNGYYTIGDGRLESRVYGSEAKTSFLDTDSDVYYPVYTVETLRQYMAGEKPSAGLEDMVRTRKVLDEIINKAERGV
mgnify:FL=1